MIKVTVGASAASVFRLNDDLSHATKSFRALEELFKGKCGIEIGGPSAVFAARGLFPVYPLAKNLDNCNFGGTTVWEGAINSGQTFQFHQNQSAGRQYIAEATSMDSIASFAYDFVLSSHMLEHTANPILALKEWVRLLKMQGILVLVLPHKDGTFDHRRPVTTMQHIIDDFNANMGEDDLTHLNEIIEFHDLSRDLSAGDLAAFKARSVQNVENRCLHHHVFDTSLAVNLVDYLGLKILAVEAILPMHIMVVAQKLAEEIIPNNTVYLDVNAAYRRLSPFDTDRVQGG